jgi:hypothetical protein
MADCRDVGAEVWIRSLARLLGTFETSGQILGLMFGNSAIVGATGIKMVVSR